MTVINIRGVIVDLLLKIDPEFYGPLVTTYKKGEKFIIVQCMNAIYWKMVASLLYYKKFVKKLKSTGLQLNPYYPCVLNCLVEDKQQTIWFEVDNCKLIHQDSKVNYEFINTFRGEYESVFENGYGKIKVIQGKVHDYLGMTVYHNSGSHQGNDGIPWQGRTKSSGTK